MAGTRGNCDEIIATAPGRLMQLVWCSFPLFLQPGRRAVRAAALHRGKRIT